MLRLLSWFCFCQTLDKHTVKKNNTDKLGGTEYEALRE